MTDCRYYQECNAPLCPKYQHIDFVEWYPDNDVCRIIESAPAYIKRQRKIKQAFKGNPDQNCFTFKMLSHSFVIKPGIKGLDLNKPTNKQQLEAEWIAKRKTAPGFKAPGSGVKKASERQISDHEILNRCLAVSIDNKPENSDIREAVNAAIT